MTDSLPIQASSALGFRPAPSTFPNSEEKWSTFPNSEENWSVFRQASDVEMVDGLREGNVSACQTVNENDWVKIWVCDLEKGTMPLI